MDLSTDDQFLQEVTSHMDRRPDQAYCLACEGGGLIHIMVSCDFGDPTICHVSARRRDPRGMEALARLRRVLKMKGIASETHRSNVTGATSHVRFQVPA